jgi:hypothetical protein
LTTSGSGFFKKLGFVEEKREKIDGPSRIQLSLLVLAQEQLF